MVVGGLLKSLSKLSLGLVLIAAWGFMYIKVDSLFPSNVEAMRIVLTTYLLFTALIFSFDTFASRKTERALFKVGFLKEFPKFLLFAGIGLVGFFLIAKIVRPEALISIKTAISGIGLGVVLLHALFVSIFETLVFIRRIPLELKDRGISKNYVWAISIVLFAAFHWALNKTIWGLVIYIPLGFIFMFINEKTRSRTGLEASGVHFAYNLFILGFLI